METVEEKQARVDLLNADKDDLQRQLEVLEGDANRMMGKFEAEREKLLALLEAKDAEIARQAESVEEPLAVEVDMPFQEPEGTCLPPQNLLNMPIVTDIDEVINDLVDEAFTEANVDYLSECLKEADIDLSVFDFFDVSLLD